MTLYDLIGNLETYELKLNQDHLDQQHGESRKNENLFLKTTQKQGIKEDDMILVTRRFQRAIKKGRLVKKSSSSKSKVIKINNTDGCYKYRKKYHLVKDYPLWETEWKLNNHENGKQQKRDLVP